MESRGMKIYQIRWEARTVISSFDHWHILGFLSAG